jgi:hypothetical protein
LERAGANAMIFRLSQKLAAKIKAGSLRTCPLDANPLADWSAHVFSADRTQYILLTNTPSLYSVVTYAKGITNDNRFINYSLDSIREFMENDGHALTYQRLIVAESSSICFAKAWNRSVISSMNDLIFHATVWLTEGNLSPRDVGFKLNDIPFSSLSANGEDRYAKPREVFQALAGS